MLFLNSSIVNAVSVIGFLVKNKDDLTLFIENKSDIEILAIGIGHDVSRNYNKAIKITDLQELIESFNDRSEVTNEALQTKLNEIVEKINDIEEINISSHTLLEDQINQILESKKHWK